MRAQFGILALLATLLGSGVASANTIYYTSMNAGDSTFASYDVGTGVWTSLTPYATTTQMTSDDHGNLYAYHDDTHMIQVYDPATDSWADVMNAPDDQSSWGSLEVTSTGRFLYSRYGSNQLSYSDGGGIWNSVTLPFQANAIGDYDPLTNQYVVGEISVSNIHRIDVATFAVTSYVGNGYAAEFRRMGSILDGMFYENTGSSGIRTWDLSNPSAPSSTMAQPAQTMWLASAVDRSLGTLYVVDLYSGAFFASDPGGFVRLADAPGVANHSSLVHVGSVPEPLTATLMLVGLAMLAFAGSNPRTGRDHAA